MTVEHHDLKRKALSSAGWTLARIGTDQGASFIIFVILAHLLNPAEMGLFVLALALAELGKLIAGAGFPDTVIREPVLDEELADAIFWANLGLGMLVFGLLALLAKPLSVFFHQPALMAMIAVLSLIIPLSALGSIHTARSMRAFGHRAVAARAIASNLLGGAVAIWAAQRGFGAWSMVLQRGVVETVMVVLAWQAFPWLPGRRPAFARVRPLLRFSLNTMLSQVLLVIMMRSQDLIIGRALSVAAVGIYRMGWRAIDLLIQLCIGPLSAIALPTLARLHDDRRAFNAAMQRLNATIATIACPAMLGFGAVAPHLVPLVFGAQWAQAGQVAQILSLMALPYATSALTGPVFAARGAAQVSVQLAWLQLLVALPVVMLSARFGPVVVAIAYVARGYCMWPVQIFLMLRETGLPLRALLRVVYVPVGASLVAGASVLGAEPWLARQLTGWPYVIAALGLNAAVLTAMLLLFGRRFLQDQWIALRAVRPG